MAIRFSRRIVYGSRGYQASFGGFKGVGLSKASASRELEQIIRGAVEGDYLPLVIVGYSDTDPAKASRAAVIYRTPNGWNYQITTAREVEGEGPWFKNRGSAETAARVRLAISMIPWRTDFGLGLFPVGYEIEHRRHAHFVAERIERNSCTDDGIFGDAAAERIAKRMPARVDALVRKFPLMIPESPL